MLFIGLLILEDTADASTSSRRRRRRVSNCIEQVEKMPYSKIDCSKINRSEFVKILIEGQDSLCSEARSAYTESEILEVAKTEHTKQLTLAQCFGKNLDFATPEEKITIEKGREELKIQAEKQAKFLITSLGVVSIVFVLLIFIF